MNAIRFTVPTAPRTKKTHNRIVQIKGKNGARGFTKVLPSEEHEKWFKGAMTFVPAISEQLRRQGVQLPITGQVEVEAIFYRDRLSGDLLGYEQAIADWMQTEQRNADTGKVTRKGAGIIVDDVQIASWDGSRLRKDAANPRIEVTIYPLEGQLDLLPERPPEPKYPVIRNTL